MRSLGAGAKLSAVLTLILVLGLVRIAAAQNAGAADPPLTFGNNFFVTGDYVVAGAQGMTTNFDFNNGLAIGTITVPDPNPGIKPSIITGTNSVPTGAQIVAAILYWQTVEKIGVMAGQPGSGQKGFFRPLIAGGVTAPGYAISGVQLNPLGSNAVSWSSGGCTSGSTGKVVRTYRTSVLGYLPIDSNGNVRPNVQYEVRLPGTSSTTPIAVGASLILIYRVISSNFPLNSIVIYDGDFATNATSVAAMTMTQAMQGFYDAETDLTQHPGAKLESRLTHIVGNGKAKKTETVSLNGQVLPSFYPHGHPSFPPYTGTQPPFPGFYGTWDNPTWTFDPGQTYVSLSNPIGEHSGSATSQVAASGANPGCVDWGATIVSTTVNNSDEDGILDVWKVPPAPNTSTPGYCDASVNEGQCNGPRDPAWVDLPGAVHGEKDVFIQLDYMCSSPNGVDSCTTGDGTNYSFDPRQTGADVLMTNAFFMNGHGVHLHINPVNPLGTTQPVHAIQELTCMDNSNNPLCASVNANGLTPFPNQPGVVGWKAGFEFIQSQPLNYPDEISCEQALSGPCIRRFQPGRKDSYHYALFAHAIGTPTWGLEGGSLASVTAFTNGDIKFTTSAPHGLVVDPNLGNGRVTIADAITNPNLNGTYKVTSVSPPAGVFAITQTSMNAGIATYTFTQVSGPAPFPGDLVTVTNTTNGNAVFNVGNATIATVVGSTFTVNFNVNGFAPSAIAAQAETGGCAPAFPTRACANTNRPPFYFTINISPSTVSTQTSYTELTDPNLTVTSGQATTGSGFSDIGGADTLVTLGLWGNPALNGQNGLSTSDGQKEPVQAGTFMHELGHTLGLTHGGLFFDNVAHNPSDYTPTFDVNCKSNYQSVMNYMFQTDLLGPSNALDFSSQQLDTLNETLLFPIALGGSTGAVKFSTTTWYDLTPNFRIDPITHLPIQVGSKAKHHCDGSPTFFNANVPPFSADVTPIMYPHLNKALPNPSWSAPSLDINFNGTIDASFRGYDDWANVDLRQIGASGPDLGGAGRSGGGPGRSGGGPGRSGGGPGRSGGGPGRSGGGPGKEIDFATANDVTRPPRNLMASEEVSPRFIDLSWTAPIFGQIGAYRIYRSADGGRTFSLIATVPGSQTTFRDGVITPPPCNTTGYQYFVTAVLAGTFATFPPGPTEGQESEPSNTVSTGQTTGQLLTACYTPGSPLFVSPVAGSSPLAGSTVTVQWTVQDTSNKAGTSANNPGSNSLVAIGPISNDVACISSTVNPPVNTPRSPIAPLGNGNGIMFDGTSQFSFNWNTAHGFLGSIPLNLPAGAFPPGCYRLELDMDSGQPTSGNLSAFQVQFFLSDVNESVVIATTSLLDATVGIAYNQQLLLQATGGVVAPLSWTVVPNSGSLPAGFTLDPALGTISGTTLTAGTYKFTVQVTDSIGDFGTQPLTLTVHIFVSTSQPPASPPFVATTALTNGVVGSPYNNTVYESGGVSDGATPFKWMIVSGSVTRNGSPAPDSSLGTIMFQSNTVAGGNNGTLSGTPTAPGIYTFTAMVTDSASNTGTQTLTLNVADALFGDLIVVDGAPLANPLAGTLFRVTPAGTSGTIAAISRGQPSGVAVDANTGNIYVAANSVGGNGTTRIVKIDPFGVVTDPFIAAFPVVGAVLQNPIALAVDASRNVYVADNIANAIYEFNSSGTQVGAGPFASLPSSSHIRIAFDNSGNLDVASDNIGGVAGQVEVDQIASNGTLTVLYNTTSKSTATYPLTAASAADVNGNTTYTGTFSPTIPANSSVTIAGFTGATDNGTFTVVSCSSTQLVVMNSGGMAETPNNPGSATLQLTAIGAVGGIAVFSDGSIDVADSGAKAIYKITNPGAANMSVTTDISAVTAVNPPPSPLCCNISGMANPPGGANTNLFITLTGVNNTKPQLQQAVPATSTVTTVNLTYSLTQASAASSGNTTYMGTFSPTIAAGSFVTIAGFTTNATNNGTFAVVSCSSTQLVVVNGNGVPESNSGTAQTVPLTFPNDLTWYSKH